MHNYVRREHLELQENKVRMLEREMKMRTRIDFTQGQLNKLRADIDDMISKLTTSDDFEYSMKQYKNSLNKAVRKMNDEVKPIKQFESRIKEFSNQLNRYCTITDINERIKAIWKNFDRCCSYDHIIEFKGEVYPRIRQCENLVSDFKIDVLKSQKIMRRFDEVLLEKASKFSINEIYKRFEDYVKIIDFEEFQSGIKHKDYLKQKEFDGLTEKVEENHDYIMGNLEGSISMMVSQVEAKVLKNIKSRSIDQETLNSAMALKADKTTTEKLNENKADKTSVQENMSMINLTLRQLESTVILMTEFLDNHIAKPNKTDNSTSQKYNFLFKQTNTLLKWINSKEQPSDDLKLDITQPNENMITVMPFPMSGMSTSRSK